MHRLSDITGAVAVVAFFALMLEQSRFGPALSLPLGVFTAAVRVMFLTDVLVRLAAASDRRRYVRRCWYDLFAVLPVLGLITPRSLSAADIVVRQAAIIVMLVTRTRRVRDLFSRLNLRPAQLMVVSFSAAICVGAVLLTLPPATTGPARLSLLDAFFTATSAVCVTGLTVRDTARDFTLLGQIVILALIQLGGLGIMTFSAFLTLMSSGRLGMRDRIVMHDVLEQEALADAGRMIRFIVRMTLVLEAAGALALAIGWIGQGRAVAWWSVPYHAVFHAVSAFCNAGFSTFSDNLVRFAGHTWTNLVVCVLVVSGGLGFAVVHDIAQGIAGLRVRRRFRLRVQTKIVLAVSALLIGIGALALAAFEPVNSEGGVGQRILVCVFQSVSARTAGFNTCAIGQLTNASVWVIILLMFIGASPGSTGGGIKTTTAAVLWATMMNGFTRATRVEIFKRTIPSESIIKAVSLLAFSLAIAGGAVAALCAVEDKSLRDLLFESVSALATVGLSTGITPHLSPAGKAIVTLLMFVGRLGPLTIAYALVRERPHAPYAYAEERVMIG